MGITLTAGKVSGWADQSGAGNHFTQSTGANQPTYTDKLNNVPCVTFTPQNFMTCTAISFAAPGLSFVVIYSTTSTDATSTTATTNPPITAMGDNTGGAYVEFGLNNGTQEYHGYSGAAWVTVSGPAGGQNDGNPRFMAATHASSGGAVTVYSGSSSSSGTITYNASFYKLRCVGAGYPSVDGFDGKIGEILAFNKVLSAAEIVQLRAYARNVWGAS